MVYSDVAASLNGSDGGVLKGALFWWVHAGGRGGQGGCASGDPPCRSPPAYPAPAPGWPAYMPVPAGSGTPVATRPAPTAAPTFAPLTAPLVRAGEGGARMVPGPRRRNRCQLGKPHAAALLSTRPSAPSLPVLFSAGTIEKYSKIFADDGLRDGQPVPGCTPASSGGAAAGAAPSSPPPPPAPSPPPSPSPSSPPPPVQPSPPPSPAPSASSLPMMQLSNLLSTSAGRRLLRQQLTA